MRRPGRCFPLFVLLIVSLAAGTVCSWAADPASPSIKVTPAMKAKVEPLVRALAKEFAGNRNLDKDIAFALLANYLWRNPSVFGAAFAFVPVKKDGKEFKSAPYIYRAGEKLVQKDLVHSFDYTEPDRKWYSAPLKMGKAGWSEPYFDKGGGEAWMVTYSVPVYSSEPDRRIIGIVTSDVLISAG
jgi:hypothetical protein